MSNVPKLRGLGAQAWTKVLIGSIAFGASLGILYKECVMEKRKKMYRDFWENKWDDKKEFEEMKAKGIFKGFEPS